MEKYQHPGIMFMLQPRFCFFFSPKFCKGIEPNSKWSRARIYCATLFFAIGVFRSCIGRTELLWIERNPFSTVGSDHKYRSPHDHQAGFGDAVCFPPLMFFSFLCVDPGYDVAGLLQGLPCLRFPRPHSCLLD